MQSVELLLEEKTKRGIFDLVSPTDFAVRTGGVVDPRCVLERANVSLYCLDPDNRRALFVEVDRETDLLQAPFYFIAQYEAARRLIAVPYEELEALLAAEAPADVVLLYSTGRCGSTLLSHVLNQSPSTMSFSEPDVFSQLVRLRGSLAMSNTDTAAWLRVCLLIMAANARRQGFERCAFKFRSYVLALSELLYSAVPDAKSMFLYRNARTWAQSFSRAFGASDDYLTAYLFEQGFRHIVPGVDAHLRAHDEKISWPEFLAHMWVSTMQACRALQKAGAPMAHARFEDLKARPELTLRALLEASAIPLPEPDKLAKVLASDSQAGTDGGQDRDAPARVLTAAELEELDRTIRSLDPTLEPGTVLAHGAPRNVV